MTETDLVERGRDALKRQFAAIVSANGGTVGSGRDDVKMPADDIWEAYSRAAISAISDGHDGWQPIETAPQDGTDILLGNADDQWRCEGYYDPDTNGWWRANNDSSDVWGGPIYPTHWRSLPNPPSAT